MRIVLPLALALMCPAGALAAPEKFKPAPAGANLMAKVPIRLGYYVNSHDRCSAPTWVTKFGPSSVTEIDDEGAAVMQLSSVKPEAGTYWLQFAGEFEEADPQGIQLEPKGPGRIEVTIQDTATMHFCRPEELPAKFRK